MKTKKAIGFNAVTTIICTALLLFVAMSSAFADETSTGAEQLSMSDVFAMSNSEILNNVENLISDAEVIASIEQIRSSLDGLTDDEIDYLARMIKTGYVVEHPDEYQTFLDESSAGATGSTELSTLSNPGGDWSQGVGVYPITKGKILVAADWVGTSGIGILPSGHAAIVADETYAWSSFPAFASQSGNGLGLDHAIEGVQQEANDWYLEIRHKTCFGLDVIATNESQEEAAVEWCEEQVGAAYNWALFDVDKRDELYCSQLVLAAFLDLYGIDMNSPTVQYWNGNATDGYVNGLGSLMPDDDNNLHFEYTQLVGFLGILPTTYASDDYNGFNVMLLDSNGMMIRRLEWPIWPESSIIIEAYHPGEETIELIINIDNLPWGNYRLQFTQNFTGDDNDGYSRTLGVPVTFVFSI